MNNIEYTSSLKEILKIFGSKSYLSRKFAKVINFRYGYSQEFKSICRSGDYLKAYDVGINNFDYDMLLFDDSFIQFSRVDTDHGTVLRYAYYQNPLDYISYEDYLLGEDFDPDEVGELFREFYDQEMSEMHLRVDRHIIRYDYSEKEYSEGIHSCSHFHFGFVQSVSVPVDKVLSPLAFVLYIYKACYYQFWKEEISKTADFKDLYYGKKTKLKKVKKHVWKPTDKQELFLT